MKKFLLILFLFSASTWAQGFFAYYTRISPSDSVSGKYADVVVSYGNMGRFLFLRENGYFPVWQTSNNEWKVKKIIQIHGITNWKKPEKLDLYSFVKIIKSTSQKIVVRLRYMSNLDSAGFDEVVYELYSFTPDGKIIRIIRKGTKKYDDWVDPENHIKEILKCSSKGLKEISYSPARLSKLPVKLIKGATLHLKNVVKPALWFRFDDAMMDLNYKEKDETLESIHNRKYKISGPKSYWKSGVSGTALQFDGYYTSIRIPNNQIPSLQKGFSLSAWVALGAYPFDWAPLIEQAKWGHEGYYLGINKKGYPGFHMEVGKKWYSIISNEKLKLYQWYYITATFNNKSGTLNLYINGNKTKTKRINSVKVQLSKNDVYIGLNSEKMPAIKGRIKIGKWPSLFGIDGLMDEVKIYNQPLTSELVKKIFLNNPQLSSVADNPDMEPRKFPVNPEDHKSTIFGAEYTELKYHETWDDLWRLDKYSDVVVNFDLLPVNIVSWHGNSYGPVFVMENGKLAGDQSSENYRELNDPSPAEGCCEHMSDKECRFTHIRIIENTDARVVLHWRYALVDSRYTFVKTGQSEGDWADEYWTIYPDGIAVRYLKRGKIWDDSWVETMVFNEPGYWPEDDVNLKAYSLMNMKGEIKTYSWKNGSPKCNLRNPTVGMVNLKSEYKMFNIYPSESKVKTFPGHNKLSHFHWWNHFPVSQITSDGRDALAPDRLSHSSLVWGVPSKDFLMYGLTDKSIKSLMPLAKSWNNPPKITNTKGCISLGYKQSQRAYYIEANQNDFSFTLAASESSPAVNPAFVIRGINNKSEISINGKSTDLIKNVRQGLVRDTDGELQLVVWIKYRSTKPVNIMLKD